MLGWQSPGDGLAVGSTQSKAQGHGVGENHQNMTDGTAHNGRPIGVTKKGESIAWFVDAQQANGVWSEQIVPASVAGLSRDISIYRAPRISGLIAYDWHGDGLTFCPPMWWDLAIGSGACGLGCRACFLMLTHRIRRDPLRHLLYDNLDDFVHAAEKWLRNPERKRQHTLGVGIDRSDSLLYEGVAPHVRNISALFGSSTHNPLGNKLILLTKSVNTHYLQDIAEEYRRNIVVSFSLNPETIADLWEGKWPDTGERITPSIRDRVAAAKYAQDLGFEVRIRLDPILTPNQWLDRYREFVSEVKVNKVDFTYWTLGTYREKNPQLDAWRAQWGLPSMEWQPDENEMESDGTHRHLAVQRRIDIYRDVRNVINEVFPHARVSLCKETHVVRKLVGLCNADCNCLI